METNRITLWQEDKTSTTIYANLADVSTPIGSVLLLHDMAEATAPRSVMRTWGI